MMFAILKLTQYLMGSVGRLSELDCKDFNVVSQRDLGACNVDSGKIRVDLAVRPLTGTVQDSLFTVLPP